MIFNVLSTGRGYGYTSVLAGGTRIWLNAETSLSYFTDLKSAIRVASIKGEVFFEVPKDLSRPFTVMARGIRIEGIDAHFNINAYEDEEFTTVTLLQGGMSVCKDNNDDSNLWLFPGEQIYSRKDGPLELVRNGNSKMAIAWKDGLFSFNNTSIESIMRQISRWYDIKVQFQSNISTPEIVWDDLSRNIPLKRMLAILESSGIKFSMNGNTMLILNGR